MWFPRFVVGVHHHQNGNHRPYQWARRSQFSSLKLGAVSDEVGTNTYKLFGYHRRDSVYKTWKRVCDKAEIDRIMPHAAGRHGFGTEMMVRQGLDAVTVAKVGRWADSQMLFKNLRSFG
ncbi:site-specific integrase [Profundibacter amoris]|uniref:hypothetical protein n=1 Tax=Profundibacter amoris TaxID=2171755 RepID=UPI0013C34812|nr:hypothetical protein [Profundibacter amoris]